MLRVIQTCDVWGKERTLQNSSVMRQGLTPAAKVEGWREIEPLRGEHICPVCKRQAIENLKEKLKGE